MVQIHVRPRNSVELSATQAREIALAAQGFGLKPPTKPGLPHLRGTAKRLHALQLDSVSVLVRSHYLPFFSRLGPYPRNALDRLVNDRHDLIELNAHQASLVPVDLEPLLRWKGEWARSEWVRTRERIERERPGYIAAIERMVDERGPLTLSDLPDKAKREKVPTRYAESSTMWWRWSDGKAVLDGLVAEGKFALAGRRGFDRMYDLAERVIPKAILDRPTPDETDAKRELTRLAAGALGVATAKDLAGYFMIKVNDARVVVRDLLEAGQLIPSSVEGWKGPAYLDPKAVTRKATPHSALLSPFDSLTWSRDRTKRLLDFDFSFEIYVPEEKRRFGYYVLPFLMDGGLVARVDLKADRKSGTLLVQSAFAEPSANRGEIAGPLFEHLKSLADWLALEEVSIRGRGDLSPALKRESRA